MLNKLFAAVVLCVLSMGFAVAAVNINTATAEQLESLPEIGPGKARAIIEYRKAHGNFKTLEDIKNVKGIGDKTFDKLKPQLALSGETKIEAAPAKADKPAATKPAAATPADKSVKK